MECNRRFQMIWLRVKEGHIEQIETNESGKEEEVARYWELKGKRKSVNTGRVEPGLW